MSPGFVELDRRFDHISESTEAEEEASSSYATYFDLFGRSDGSLSWTDLLKLHVVVVLGEPGSGKTWELRQRACKLTLENKYAFYVRLDELAGSLLENCLQDRGRFTQWRRSSKRAHFFLDSVDEAKFRSHNDFRTALEKFARELESREIVRASFVVSSRISEWQPSLDEPCLSPLFPPRESKANQTDPESLLVDKPTYVLLRPLNARQIRLLVGTDSNVDVEAFMRSLDEANAWEFTRRPSDAKSLAEYWKRNRTFGTLFELVDLDIREKLKESDERQKHDLLTPARLRDGAQSLAVANILCRRSSFHVPEGPRSSSGDALSPRECLREDWKTGEQTALLNRALFDSAAYGKIRIYHRRVTEYLCAEWINRCMNEGCTTRRLKDLLLCTANGTTVVRPLLAPVVAWLGCGDRPWNDEIRLWLLRTKPSILLQYGDPSSLPADFQLNVLNAIVDRYGDSSETWISTDSEILARFSGNSVSARICQILLDPMYGEGVKRLMLRIVRFARLGQAIEEAIKLFGLPDSSVALRMYCMAAVRDVGTQPHRQALCSVFNGLQEVPASLLGIACETLYPAEMSPADLAAAIKKSPEDSIRTIGRGLHVADVFESSDSMDQSVAFLAEINQLLQTTPHISSVSTTIPISEKYCWCGMLLEPNLRSALRIDSLSDDDSWIVAESIMFYEELINFADLHLHVDDQFDILLRSNTSVRRAYVWLTSKKSRTEKTVSVPTRRLSLSWGLFHIEPQDRRWLLADLVKREDLFEKQVALGLLMELSDRLLGSRDVKKAISQCLTDRDTLLHEYKSVRRVELRRYFLRFRNLWLVRVRRKVSQGIRELGRYLQQRWEKYFDFVLHIRSITSGKHLNFLYESITQHRDGGDQWSRFKWRDLLKRSPFVGRVVRKGCKNAWRRYTPQLMHERTRRNGIELATIVGLPGIAASIEDGELEFAQVSQEEAVRLVHYAFNELNGVPEWFEHLAEVQPDVVMAIIERCMEEDWKTEDYGILHRILYHCERFAPSLSKIVLRLLVKGDPGSHLQLIDALILLGRCEVRHKLGEIAAGRVRCDPLVEGKVITWLSVLMELDAPSALELLREARESQDESYDQLVENLCSALSREPGDPFPRFSNPSYMQPDILLEFIPMVFDSVRMPDDLARGFGAYFPTARDAAQQFRNGILAQLASNESLEAHTVLVRLRDHPSLARMKEYLDHLIEKQLELSAIFEPWEEKDIRDFERKYEIVPQTARSLYDIALRRFDDIKIAVEESDRSIRRNVRKGDNERCLRIFLARQLAERSRGAYDPPEEVEIDLEERPDIRVVHPGLSPVSVEIKVAEKWSFKELYSMLQEQLVDQYLKPNGSRYGIYVLGYINKEERGSWKNRQLNFLQLIEALRERAREIVRDDTDVDGLEVIGIDFHEPER